MAALPAAAVDAHPRVLLHLARAAETSYRGDLRKDAIERAAQVAVNKGDAIGNGALKREIQAEQARDLLWDERTWSQARDLAQQVLDECEDDEPLAKARSLDVLGRHASWMSSVGIRSNAGPLLQEATRLALDQGKTTWAAQSLVVLAIGVHFAAGRYQPALDTLDQALAVLPYRRPYRALIQSFKCDVLCEMGQFAKVEAGIEEMADTYRATRENWIPFFISWSEALLASYSGDHDRTVRAVLDCEQHQRELSDDNVSKLEFLTQAADLLDRVGEPRMARERIELARERAENFERTFKVYEAIIAGRSGEPEETLRLTADVLIRKDLEPQDRWPVLLARARAAQRCHHPLTVQWAAEAFETAASLGHPEGPMVRDREMAQHLLPLAASGSGAASNILRGAGQVTVALFGSFNVSRGGRFLSLPAGRPAKAVRIVAANGGWIHSEELQELLWPDSELISGRNRLRNILSRLRASAGPLLQRHGEGIALAEGVQCDLLEFENHARKARDLLAAGDRNGSAAHARSALSYCTGNLLPGDRYETWAEEARERLNRIRLELLDIVTEESEARADVDDAVRQIERAIEIQRYDEVRYVRLATLLASQGRVGTAKHTLSRARSALAELELVPSSALERLEMTLGEALAS